MDPAAVAQFLRSCPGLNKQTTGELLGEYDEFFLEVLRHFTDTFDFTGTGHGNGHANGHADGHADGHGNDHGHRNGDGTGNGNGNDRNGHSKNNDNDMLSGSCRVRYMHRESCLCLQTIKPNHVGLHGWHSL